MGGHISPQKCGTSADTVAPSPFAQGAGNVEVDRGGRGVQQASIRNRVATSTTGSGTFPYRPRQPRQLQQESSQQNRVRIQDRRGGPGVKVRSGPQRLGRTRAPGSAPYPRRRGAG